VFEPGHSKAISNPCLPSLLQPPFLCCVHPPPFPRTRLAGIDIAGLPYVINMTLPDPVENCVGRVGRADCIGLAISIVATAGIKEKVGGGRSMLACLRCASLAGPCPGPNTALCSGRGGFLRLEGLSHQIDTEQVWPVCYVVLGLVPHLQGPWERLYQPHPQGPRRLHDLVRRTRPAQEGT
jgi:hypothetical protein